MCLAVPGKIVEIYQQDGLLMGNVDFGGTIRRACLQYVPEARVNQYALIHVGFALSTIEEDEAERTLALLRSIGDPYAELSGVERDGASSECSEP